MGELALQSSVKLPGQQATEAAAIISVIERAARDPSVDIDKMERLMLMHQAAMERHAKGAYFAALAEMQPKLPVVERRGMIRVPAKDGKTGHETAYALWEDVNEAIRPHLAEHGFALSFRVKKEGDRVEVTGILSHREGHAEETMLSLPMDATGSKNNVQAIGSSVSYGKRYTAFALLNITSRGEDDDGRAADAADTINDEQAEELRRLIKSVGANEAEFLAWAQVATLADVPAKHFEDSKRVIQSYQPQTQRGRK